MVVVIDSKDLNHILRDLIQLYLKKKKNHSQLILGLQE